MIKRHHPEYIEFPDPKLANTHGLLAHGGDLSTATILSAYQQGIFPWFNDNEPILWWSPDPRMILPTADVHISRSLKKTLRSQRFNITCGQAFSEVIDYCSKPRTRDKSINLLEVSAQTWLTQDMKTAYIDLHKAGFAQSIECWHDKHLVGGLYGVTIAGMFFGESMFSTENDSSKVALVALCQYLQKHGIHWIDCQVESKHLVSLGAVNISRKNFIKKINYRIENPQEISWTEFNFE